jgi:hypothetical protein
VPDQSEDDDDWNGYAQQPKQDSSTHIFLPMIGSNEPCVRDASFIYLSTQVEQINIHSPKKFEIDQAVAAYA